MKKRFGAVVMAGMMACTVATCLSMTGCVSGKKPTFEMPEGGFDITTPVEITMYHTMGATLTNRLKAQIEAFQQIYPNITVKQENVGNYDSTYDTVSHEILVDEGGPNITYCYGDHVAFYNVGNAVQPLNDFIPGGAYADYKLTLQDGTETTLGMTEEEKNMFIESYWNEGYQFGDGETMYMLPFSKSTEVMYYNKTFFTEHGLEPPTTWDEMEDVCEEIKKINSNAFAFGYDSESNWFITMCEQGNTPYTSAEGENYLWDTPENRAFVKRFKGWYDLGYFTTQQLNGNYTSGIFQEQKCYMCIGSSAGAQYQAPAKVDGVYPFEVGIVPIPQLNPEKPKVISQGPSVCILKHKDPQEVLASWLFVKFLTTNIDFQAAFSNDSGYMPVLKMDYMQQNAIYKKYLEDAETGGNDYLTGLSVKVCSDQASAYYTSPAFAGSAMARQQVGGMMTKIFGYSGSNIDGTIASAFQEAINMCKYSN